MFYSLYTIYMNCSTKAKVLGGLRILLWVFMLAMWVMKFGADAATMEMVGGAWAALWLWFLSVGTWFWIAVAWEIIAWAMLLSGCKKLVKLGAILTLIIMVFAIGATGFGANAIVTTIAALVILVMWGWCWTLCKLSCCKGGSCSTGACDIQQQQ